METSGEWMTSEIVLTMGRRVTDNVFSSTAAMGKHNWSTLTTETDDLAGEENTRRRHRR